jgi:ankyrin repeat protein
MSFEGKQVVRMLLGAGAGDGKRINRVTNSGNTSLHFACTGQHAEVASLLQLYKPDVYATNSYGQTPVSLGKAFILNENKKSSIFTLPCFVEKFKSYVSSPFLCYVYKQG